MRGWYSYPVESQELLLDGATAMAAGVGLVYWGLSRFFYQPEGPLAYESGRYVKEIFDFQQKHDALLRSVQARPQAGILVGEQTIDWYSGKHFVGKAYENYATAPTRCSRPTASNPSPFWTGRCRPNCWRATR